MRPGPLATRDILPKRSAPVDCQSSYTLHRMRFARAMCLAKRTLVRSHSYRMPGRARRCASRNSMTTANIDSLREIRRADEPRVHGGKLCILVLCQYLTRNCVMIRTCVYADSPKRESTVALYPILITNLAPIFFALRGAEIWRII